MFTLKEKPQKKTGGLKKKYSKHKSAIKELCERTERYDFLNSLARAPDGITFGQIANVDVDKVRKELQKIITKKVTRLAVNVTSEDSYKVQRHLKKEVDRMLTAGTITPVVFLDITLRPGH